MSKLRCFCYIGMMLCLLPSCVVQRQGSTVLDKLVTMKVYSAEILESVINRLQADTGTPIDLNVQMLLPYMAKAADYKNVTVKAILEEQLGGTTLTYQIKKKKLTICLKLH